jgi:hypothetical protein
MDLLFSPEIDCGKKEAAHDRKSHPLSRPGP